MHIIIRRKKDDYLEPIPIWIQKFANCYLYVNISINVSNMKYT